MAPPDVLLLWEEMLIYQHFMFFYDLHDWYILVLLYQGNIETAPDPHISSSHVSRGYNSLDQMLVTSR